MAGIALLLDLLKSSPDSSSSTSSSVAFLLHSHHLFSAGAAASAVASYIVSSRHFVSRAIFGDGGISVAYCDAGATATWNENYIPNLTGATGNMLPDATGNENSVIYECKEYPIELRHLFSAFQLRSLALTSLRSFLQFYLPLLEPHPPVEDVEDLSQDVPENKHLDLVTPFHKSLKQIVRETSVVTIRRLLERLVVNNCSPRTAWKLLKDVSKSAKRKATRDMPAYFFLFHISRTTLRAHALGVVASWIVQNMIGFYRYFIQKPNSDSENLDKEERIRLFMKKMYSTTVLCTSSLIFASVGAGIGALFHPSIGQWIGSAVGDFGGPLVVVICFEKLHLQL